ncbi:hypothetical protein L873DRAFT_1628970, partial [Choiromyces venosus 120613-1]
GHRASFGHAMSTGFDYLIGVPNLDDTFNRRAFPLEDIKETSERVSSRSETPQNILDHSPTPNLNFRPSTQVVARTGAGRSSRGRSSRGDTTRNRAKQRQPNHGLGTSEEPGRLAKTFVRPMPPHELLEHPVTFNSRITMHIAVMSPLYVGGARVDGRLNIHIHGTRLDDIRMGRVGIDLVGIEGMRKVVFMSVTSELVDEDHPPPASILHPMGENQTISRKVKPSRLFLLFRLNLPLNVGPGPFHSVRARIRYVIHGTIMATINGIKTIIRCSRDIRVISALDPEKTLLPLEVPLLATEEHALRWGGHNTLKVTAGLFRAVWISGTAAYVDVSIINNTRRRVHKIRLKLKRHMLAYKRLCVALAENKSVGHLRVPDWTERKTLAHSKLNIRTRWKGVHGNQFDVVTREIDIPRNQSTVKTGRFLQVKYFVDIAVCTCSTVGVQLPLTIIHINPPDIMPNHLPQVSSAFSEHLGKKSEYLIAGREFFAPRQ